ncbi:MAG: hypothetical protein WAN36_09395 [Calditrichia bacterium]
MADIKFETKTVSAFIRNPLQNFAVSEEKIQIRKDPLTGNQMRLISPKGLDKLPSGTPLQDFVANAESCFFCEGRVESQTPLLPENIHPEGRIGIGSALLFPNLAGFARYSGVCILSKKHYTAIQDFTAQEIRDGLLACREFFRVCAATDSDVLYPSVNMNYLLPAGSSILHPHLQPVLDPFPTNNHLQMLQGSGKYMQENNSSYWTDLISQERGKERFILDSENMVLLAPFAPTGFNEVNLILKESGNFAEFPETMLEEIGTILQQIFRIYHHLQHNSFNLAIFSPPVNRSAEIKPMPCVLKICTRPTFTGFYRNDITFFERFHGESMLDRAPEAVAEDFRLFIAGRK